MSLELLWDIFKILGSVVGTLITFITFWGLISKKPKAAIRKVIREESTQANKKIEKQLDCIEEQMTESNETDVVLLRHSITNLYHNYKSTKQIPHYAKEDWLSMYDKYIEKGGNSYIKDITTEMKEKWEEI